jgi:hypothetical protein
MNYFIKAFPILVFITFNTLSQEINDSHNRTNQSNKPNKSLSSTIDDLYFYLDLHNFNKIFLVNTDPSTQWLWTSCLVLNSRQETLESNINFDYITLPLYQKYIKDSQLKTFRRLLKIVQRCVAFYLAYCHVKKYGFSNSEP